MRREITLKRAEDTIKDFKEDESKSKYYKELKKSYKEYESMPIHTRKIDRLYLKHMNDLCDYLIDKRNYKLNISITLFMIAFTIFCVIYATHGFNNINQNVIPRIMTKAPKVQLNVEYRDLQNLILQPVPANGNEDDLPYAYIDISPVGDEGHMLYDIYIVPVNYGKNAKNLEDYTFKVDHKAVKLSSKDFIGGKIKIYSGSMKSNETVNHKLRLWINREFRDIYKDFSFNIYVEGYII